MYATGEREGTLNQDDGDGLLLKDRDLHGEMCSGGSGCTWSAMRPTTMENHAGEPVLVAVYMEWCSDCGAAAWEVVS